MSNITVTIDEKAFDAATLGCHYARDSVESCPDLVAKYVAAYDAMIKAAVDADIRVPFYWVQTKAPAGNWVDNLGSANLKDCNDQARFLEERGEEARVVERVDVLVTE